MYYIERSNNTYYIWFKTDLTKRTKKKILFKKNNDKQPEDPYNFFDFYDGFDNNVLDMNVWDDSKAGNYDVSDKKLKMWSQWGSWCCRGDCYFDSIITRRNFRLPLRVRIQFNQQPYDLRQGCLRTGVSLVYGKSFQISTSTDSDDKQGINVMINNSVYNGTNISRFPDIAPEFCALTANLTERGLFITDYWEDRSLSYTGSTPNSTYDNIGVSGDTDSNNAIDNLNSIAIFESKTQLPTINVLYEDNEYLFIELDDTNNQTSEDYSNFIFCCKSDTFITSLTEGVEIVDVNTRMLFVNPDNNEVFYYDYNSDSFQSLNKPVDLIDSSDFIQYGSEILFNLTKDKLEAINSNNIRLITYSTNNSSSSILLEAIPKKQMLQSKNLINLALYSSVTGFEIVSNDPQNIFMLFTTDLNTWYKYNPSNDTFVSVFTDKTFDIHNDSDIQAVVDQNFTVDDFNGIDPSKLTEFLNQNNKKLGFVFIIDDDSFDSDKTLTEIRVNGIISSDIYTKEDVDIRYNIQSDTTIIKVQNEGQYLIFYI